MTEQPSVLMTTNEVAARLGMHEQTARKVIADECGQKLRDEIRMIPGGRHSGAKYFVYRNIFEHVIAGKALGVEAVKPSIPFLKHRGAA